MQHSDRLRKYAVTVEGGFLSIVEAASKRDAERSAARDWAGRMGVPVSWVETLARIATPDDIAWHRAMGGHG